MGHASRLNPRAVAAAQAGAAFHRPILDRYGRPILEGGQYEFHSHLPALYKCVSIRPILDPGAQPGTYTVELQTTVRLVVPTGQPIDVLTLIAPPAPSQEALAGEQAASNGSAEGSAEPSPTSTGTPEHDAATAGETDGEQGQTAPTPGSGRVRLT